MRLKSFLCLSLTLFVSFYYLSFTPSLVSNSGLGKGKRISNITLTNESNSISLKNNQKYILLNIWASYNAESRMNNVKFANFCKNNINNDKLDFVSISFDEYQSVAKQIAKDDNIDNNSLFFVVNGFDSKLAHSLQLREGAFYNCLIGENGKIIAANVTCEELNEWLEKAN